MPIPLRVLIVATSDTDAENLVRELKRGDYTLDIVQVKSASELKSELLDQPSDLILSDYDTSQTFSGREALDEVRQSGVDIPFIVVSERDGADTISDAFQSGANDYLLRGAHARLLSAIERERREVSERQQQRDAEAQLRLYNQRLTTLHAIDQAILHDVAPETVCNYALRFIGAQMDVVSGEILLIDNPNGSATRLAAYQRASDGAKETTGEQISLSIISAADMSALTNGQIQYVPRTSAEIAAPTRDAAHIASYLLVPITTAEGLVGTIMLFADKPDAFTPAQIEVSMEVAHQLAIAIRQGRFVEQIQRSSAELEQRVLERTRALQQATHRMAAILNNTSDAIIVTDNKGRIQETNPAFRELFGYFGDTMAGFYISQMFDFEQKVLLEEALKAAMTFGKADNIEATGVRADGTRFEADIAVVSLMENGALENIVYSVRDVSKRKAVEQGLREMLDQQRELNDLKSRFVSMASHEFRTPLAIIRTTTDMLGAYRDRMDDASIDMRLDKIRAQITHMTALMDDVLTLARDQAGKSAFDPEPGDLDDFCRDIVEQIRMDPDISHQIDYSCTPQPFEIMFDKMLMRKTVNNLLSNAVKYSPKGSRIGFTVTREEGFAVLRISDSGVGIPEPDQKRLFEPFHRGSNVGAISGTGLGLTITQQSIEAHGGTLNFESIVNKGTTFIAAIPAEGYSEGGT